ncbi:hypothetical protein L7F22_064485 [Adiantum nelumboides]|nr:hypothetical protein [Adiantum nelumboides]
MVMLIGDMNARIAHAQMQIVDLMTPPSLEHKSDILDPIWKRCSKDPVTNPQGVALLSMMTSLQLIAVNGTNRFANSGECTCYTANKGMSAIDYALITHEDSHFVSNFTIGERSPNSDHTPIHVCLRVHTQKGSKQPHARSWTYKMQIDKKTMYADHLENALAQIHMPLNIEQAWPIFKNALCDTVEKIMGKTYRKGGHVKGLPHNPWFDDECKLAKQQLRATPTTNMEWAAIAKDYTNLKRRKRREYETHTETQAIVNFKKNPKKEWRRMKGKRHEIIGDISPQDMYAYVEQLYVHSNAEEMPHIQNDPETTNHIHFEMVKKGIQKLANGKAPDMLQMNSEMIKWTGTRAREWIHRMLNQAIVQGLPEDWQKNWIKALYKKGDVNQPNNYRTIIVGSLEIWGASISAHVWNEIEKIQKKFLCRHLGVKKTTPYSVLLLETGKRPIEMKALKCMYMYIMKVRAMATTESPA